MTILWIGLFILYKVSTGADDKSSFKFLKALTCASAQNQQFFLDRRSLRGLSFSARCGMNFFQLVDHAKKTPELTNVCLLGPLLSYLDPATLLCLRCCDRETWLHAGTKHNNWVDSPFSIFWSTAWRCISCSSWEQPHTSTSSMSQTTPSRPSVTSVSIRFWKCSAADAIPKGKWLKKYRPNSVIKGVSLADCWAKGIFQNPMIASSLLKTAPANNLRICLAEGRMNFFLCNVSLSFVRLTQMCGLSGFLGTKTMPAYHSVCNF